MNPDNLDPLHELLRQSDADAGPPPVLPVDLAARVVQRAQARRQRNSVVSSAAALLVLAVGTVVLLRTSEPGVPTPAPGSGNLVANTVTTGDRAVLDLTQMTAEIARLDREADSHLAIARRIAEVQRREARLAVLRNETGRADSLQSIRREVDEAALALIYQGDKLYRELHLPGPAAKSYRDAARLFPDTRWAQVAQERLEEMERHSEGTL